MELTVVFRPDTGGHVNDSALFPALMLIFPNSQDLGASQNWLYELLFEWEYHS